MILDPIKLVTLISQSLKEEKRAVEKSSCFSTLLLEVITPRGVFQEVGHGPEARLNQNSAQPAACSLAWLVLLPLLTTHFLFQLLGINLDFFSSVSPPSNLKCVRRRKICTIIVRNETEITCHHQTLMFFSPEGHTQGSHRLLSTTQSYESKRPHYLKPRRARQAMPCFTRLSRFWWQRNDLSPFLYSTGESKTAIEKEEN